LVIFGSIGACATSSDTKPPPTTRQIVVDTGFARLVETLSEPAGYFDTDNLISNESSYLHVVGPLESLGVAGGAYIGVGPDQNFSYIAAVRPSVAFIVDIRRDNLLQHLLFKALFELAGTRIEYLSLLFGRPFPDDPGGWETRRIDDLIEYIDGTAADPALIDDIQTAVHGRIAGYGVPLSEPDYAAIFRIHDSFIRSGPGLRFTSFGRGPRPYYPTFRQLLLERDLEGRQANYLADEDDFQFVKQLQEKNLVIPVVGDLAGDHALLSIGQFLRERDERVSFFYTSNVEFYLIRNGAFDRFADNVTALPHHEHGVIARSYFGGMFRYPHPQAVPGYYSTQLLQPIATLVDEHAKGGYQSYLELVAKHSLELRQAEGGKAVRR
jgi:hypothetical protein